MATSPQAAPTQGNPLDDQTTRFILGWTTLIIILVMIGRTKSGYAAIYYGLTLLIFLLFVTQYQWIATVLGATEVPPPSLPNALNVLNDQDSRATNPTLQPLYTTSTYLSPGGVIHPL